MLDRTKEMLKQIRCHHMSHELASVIERAKQNDMSYLDFINELLNYEINNRKKTWIRRFQKQANFSAIKTIDEFDFRFQTSITKKEVNEWQTFTWVEERQNKILMGPPGVGKTHLALALGFSAVHCGYKVIFHTMQDLMEEMIIAEHDGNFKDYIKKILKYDLIIIDEIGYLPLKQVYPNLFFQLVTNCYEFRSILITSNKLCSEWGTLFGDITITSAILDRLMHHSEAIALNGDSYRLKDKK